MQLNSQRSASFVLSFHCTFAPPALSAVVAHSTIVDATPFETNACRSPQSLLQVGPSICSILEEIWRPMWTNIATMLHQKCTQEPMLQTIISGLALDRSLIDSGSPLGPCRLTARPIFSRLFYPWALLDQDGPHPRSDFALIVQESCRSSIDDQSAAFLVDF